MEMRSAALFVVLAVCVASVAIAAPVQPDLSRSDSKLLAKVEAALKATVKRDALSAPGGTALKEEMWTFEVSGVPVFKLHVGVQTPRDIKADILFFHGFADCLLNHAPLFDEWVRNGFRVIAFDLPSHGSNSGILNDINLWLFESLGNLARKVEEGTRSKDVPLFVAGWSTGGLIGVRLLQGLSGGLSRPVKGAFFIAPGVAVHPLVGNMGVVTQRTITSNSNPPHKCPIKPKSPLLTPLFATYLVTNSVLSRMQRVPKDLPIFMTVAGDDLDKYVKSVDLIDWSKDQNAAGAKITAVQCPNSKHEMDNEPAPVGPYILSQSSYFFTVVLAGKPFTPSSSPACHVAF